MASVNPGLFLTEILIADSILNRPPSWSIAFTGRKTAKTGFLSNSSYREMTTH